MTPSSSGSSWQQALRYANLGTTVFACVAVGLGGGYALDRWLGTQPWLLLVGLGFGIAAAGWTFYRALKELIQASETDDGN
jgi:ATP synthase protein I